MRRLHVGWAVVIVLSVVVGSVWGQVQYNITDLGTLPGSTSSYAEGINASGEVVGYAWYGVGLGSYEHAFLYSNGTMQDLNTLLGGSYSSASGINASGQVVGFAKTSTGGDAFLYSNGTMTDLGTLASPTTG